MVSTRHQVRERNETLTPALSQHHAPRSGPRGTRRTAGGGAATHSGTEGNSGGCQPTGTEAQPQILGQPSDQQTPAGKQPGEGAQEQQPSGGGEAVKGVEDGKPAGQGAAGGDDGTPAGDELTNGSSGEGQGNKRAHHPDGDGQGGSGKRARNDGEDGDSGDQQDGADTGVDPCTRMAQGLERMQALSAQSGTSANYRDPINPSESLEDEAVYRSIASAAEAVRDDQEAPIFSVIDSVAMREAGTTGRTESPSRFIVRSRHEMLVPVYGGGHTSLFVLARHGPSDDAPWSFRHYDSSEPGYHRNRLRFLQARAQVIRAGWDGTPGDTNVITGVAVDQRCGRQTAHWTCGIHTILNAWAHALGLALPATDARGQPAVIASGRGADFVNRAVDIIRLAVQGYMDSDTIHAFFECFGFIEPGQAVAANRTFTGTIPFLGPMNLAEHVAMLHLETRLEQARTDSIEGVPPPGITIGSMLDTIREVGDDLVGSVLELSFDYLLPMFRTLQASAAPIGESAEDNATAGGVSQPQANGAPQLSPSTEYDPSTGLLDALENDPLGDYESGGGDRSSDNVNGGGEGGGIEDAENLVRPPPPQSSGTTQAPSDRPEESQVAANAGHEGVTDGHSEPPPELDGPNVPDGSGDVATATQSNEAEENQQPAGQAQQTTTGSGTDIADHESLFGGDRPETPPSTGQLPAHGLALPTSPPPPPPPSQPEGSAPASSDLSPSAGIAGTPGHLPGLAPGSHPSGGS